MDSVATQHHIWDVLGDILLIFCLAGFVIPFLQRIRVSPVLGYLLCGLIIGPYSLGLLQNDMPWISAFVITDMNLIQILAELGVIFLLFMIGLELTFSRLWELRRLVLGLGSTQIAVTGLIIFFLALQFENALPTSILIGAAFALSSTAVVMQLLTEQHMISRPIGKVCFSVLLMQDLAVVPILVLVGTLAGQASGSLGFILFEVVVTAVCVVVLIIAAGKLMLRPMLRLLSSSQNIEWLFAIILFLIIGSAFLTHSFGLSAALGAFLAGLLVAETEYRHEVEVIVEPMKGLLMGIFFLSVGMATDMATISQHAFWLPVSVIGIFLIKAFVFYPIARIFGVLPKRAAHSSVLLAQCGEFAFIIIGLALVGDLLPKEDAQFFLLVAGFSLLITPLTARLAPLAEKLVSLGTTEHHSENTEDETSQGNHVIIGGFGRVGQTMAHILENQKIPYIALDNDGAVISQFHAKGYPVIFGDVRKMELWSRLKINNAVAAVLTIDDFSITMSIVKTLRQKWPFLPIVVRVRDVSHIKEYYEAGATIVVPETLESTLQLVRTLLEQIGLEGEDAQDIIKKYRQKVLS
ncbi:MAG: cation:proton antiporter [Pseudomonadota bacterium]